MRTGLILQAEFLLELDPRFGGHEVLAGTAGSQYLVNAAAQKSRAISSVHQGKARESCFPARRQTIALRSKGRRMATRHVSHRHPWLAKTNSWLASDTMHVAEDLQANRLLQNQMLTLLCSMGQQHSSSGTGRHVLTPQL